MADTVDPELKRWIDQRPIVAQAQTAWDATLYVLRNKDDTYDILREFPASAGRTAISVDKQNQSAEDMIKYLLKRANVKVSL